MKAHVVYNSDGDVIGLVQEYDDENFYTWLHVSNPDIELSPSMEVSTHDEFMAQLMEGTESIAEISTTSVGTIEVGKSYLVKYKLDPDRKNAKVLEARVHILEIAKEFDHYKIITNRRPWKEGGTGQLYFDQIVSATEIERPKEN